MVFRSGGVLLTVDDAAHFIAGGNPGLGLYASTANWRGGELSGTGPAPALAASRARDDPGR